MSDPDAIYHPDGRLRNVYRHDHECECRTCYRLHRRWSDLPATKNQLGCLEYAGLTPAPDLTQGEAEDIIKSLGGVWLPVVGWRLAKP